MQILSSSSYVNDGFAHYIIAVSFECTIIPTTDQFTCVLDGTEKVVHNGVIYPATGGTGVGIGIPAVQNTNFYTSYSEPI